MKNARVKALIKKEFFQMIRDPGSFLIAVILPLILLFIYGIGISLDITNLPIGVAMEDSSPIVQSFVDSLKESRYFSVKVERTSEPFYKELQEGKIRGFVVIPSYFSRDFFSPEKEAPIQVIGDGSIPNTSAFVQNYVRGAWINWVKMQDAQQANRRKPKIGAEPRFWYNEDLNSRFFLVPGSIAIIMTLIGTLLTAVVVSREWERGTMESLLSTPVTIWELIVSKIIPNFVLGLLSLIFCTFVSVYFYKVPFQGSWALLALVSSAFLMAALGVGLFISTLARDQFVASQMSIVSSYLPSFILSGFIFEISSMPLIIRMVTYLVPARYYVSSLQTIFLVGNVWELILYDLAFLLLFCLIVYFAIAKISRKRLD
ncbi:MAG: ABC transporter permease [Chlamydiales bacterium]|nr:ABC transporter permease [Chlamydiia bacterium]MCP5507640.1 ABC transporter permease [Chlamydiales bacterium]